MSFPYIYCGAWNFKKEVRGIRSFRMDPISGTLIENGVYGEDFAGQSILAVAGERLFAVSELVRGGSVISYSIQPDGSLEQLDAIEFQSAMLSYVAASPDGKHIFVSSMSDGTVKMIQVSEDGKLTLTCEHKLNGHSVSPRQSKAAVHSIHLFGNGQFLAAANLGADELDIFRVDYRSHTLCLADSIPVDFEKSPRHMTVHPSGAYLYLLTETGNRIYVYRIEKNSLRELAVYNTLDPDGEQSGWAADIAVSADGRFVYSSNRGQSNIAVWRVLESGLLDSSGFFDCGGIGPRGIQLTPDGHTLLCANNDSGTVTVLPLDPSTGLPGAAVQSVEVPSAGCVRTFGGAK